MTMVFVESEIRLSGLLVEAEFLSVKYLMHGRLILWSCLKQFENV